MSPEYKSWSFIGRRALVEDTASHLKAARSVILLGGPGLGKTSLANQALGQIHESTLTFRIRATPAVSEVPYGALGVLLSELDHQDLTHPMFVLQELGRHLADQAAGRTVVLFVDNVEDLDEMSAVVVSQLVRQRAIVLLCTGGAIGRVAPEFSHLWREGALAR
ncbi:ATP-binding protein, partial [Arthrobacter sp. H14]|uniref:ATP-binding protein n=1 Tax=Arthrobacter sp. H14 TaxID=1312959 RepID=UPI00047C7274